MKLKWDIDFDRSTTEALGGLAFIEVRRCTNDSLKYIAEVRGCTTIKLGKGIKGKGIGMVEACYIAEQRFFELIGKKKYSGTTEWERFITKKNKQKDKEWHEFITEKMKGKTWIEKV